MQPVPSSWSGRRLYLALAVLLCSVSVSAEQLLVAHPSVRTADITLNTARLLFSMQLRQWPDGEAVHVFVLPDDAALHRAFAKDLLSLYPRQLRRVWDRQLYSGTGRAPETVSSETEMLQRVADTPGAIGYLSHEMIDDAVRVITIR